MIKLRLFRLEKYIILLTGIILGLFLSCPVYASPRVVHEIQFLNQDRVPAKTLESTLRTKKGYIFDKARVSEDIKALYKLNQFEDIQVQSEKVRGGIKLIYIFQEKPFITEVKFSGNKKIKDEDLREKMAVRTYRPLQGEEIAQSIQNIREAYAKKGYYLAEITYHIDQNDKTEDVLVFDIKENAGAVVREVRFMGNRVFSDNKLRKVARTKRKGLFSFVTKSGTYSEEYLKNDVLRLTYHYLNNGYLRVKVSAPLVTISQDKRYIFVVFPVVEGKQYRLGKVEVSGDILTTAPEIKSMIDIEPGDIYNQGKLEETLLGLTEFYGNQGYAYANIYPDVIPNDETLTADVNFRIFKGNRIYVEQININGNDVTRDKVIRRELKIMENDRFNEGFLRKSKAKLMQLGYFEEVNFATPRGSGDDKVNLDINVKERSTGSFNIGVGFSTFEHFMFNASVSKANFFGYGISGSLSTQLSRKRYFFFLSGQDPYFLDTNMMLGGSIYHTAYSYPDFWRKALGGDLHVGRRFFENYSAQIGYKGEDVSVSSFSNSVPQFFREISNGITSAITVDLSRDTRDNRLLPKKGTYNLFTSEVASSALGGDNEYARLKYKSIFYQPIWKKLLIFKAMGRIGYIKDLGDRGIPLYERFFMGGVYDLRGYYPNSVGPMLRIPVYTSGGEQIVRYGGNKELLFIGELEFIFLEKAGLSVVAFFDAGNSYAEQDNYSLSNIRKDYGFGMRWNSPMGPLRFEWGIPLDKRPGDDNVVFNFTIGNTF